MKEINAKRKAFREELVKIMPGYKWTVHKSLSPSYLDATGIKSSGLSRLSTLQVQRTEVDSYVKFTEYKVKSSGVGKGAPWIHGTTASTLAQALRALQDWYMRQAGIYTDAAEHLKQARKELK